MVTSSSWEQTVREGLYGTSPLSASTSPTLFSSRAQSPESSPNATILGFAPPSPIIFPIKKPRNGNGIYLPGSKYVSREVSPVIPCFSQYFHIKSQLRNLSYRVYVSHYSGFLADDPEFIHIMKQPEGNDGDMIHSRHCDHSILKMPIELLRRHGRVSQEVSFRLGHLEGAQVIELDLHLQMPSFAAPKDPERSGSEWRADSLTRSAIKRVVTCEVIAATLDAVRRFHGLHTEPESKEEEQEEKETVEQDKEIFGLSFRREEQDEEEDRVDQSPLVSEKTLLTDLHSSEYESEDSS